MRSRMQHLLSVTSTLLALVVLLSGPASSVTAREARQDPAGQVVQGTGDFPRLLVVAPGADGAMALYLVEGDRAAQVTAFEELPVGHGSVVAPPSPDGKHIAILLPDSRNGGSTLVVVGVDDGRRVTLDHSAGRLAPDKGAAFEGITGLAWLDDEHILYSKVTWPSNAERDASWEAGAPLPIQGEVWLSDVDGKERHLLASGRIHRVLGAAPDGQHVYFTCDRDLERGGVGARGDAFCVLDVASGMAHTLWPSVNHPLRGGNPLNDTLFGYKLSAMPDGAQRVLFVGTDGRDGPPSTPPEIWLGDPESGEAQRIWTVIKGKPTAGSGMLYEVPADYVWSPRSQREFVYLGDGTVTGGLWWVDVEAGRSGNVAAGDLSLMAWAPEGIVIQKRGAIQLLDADGNVQGEIHMNLDALLAP